MASLRRGRSGKRYRHYGRGREGRGSNWKNRIVTEEAGRRGGGGSVITEVGRGEGGGGVGGNHCHAWP